MTTVLMKSSKLVMKWYLKPTRCGLPPMIHFTLGITPRLSTMPVLGSTLTKCSYPQGMYNSVSVASQ